MPPYSYCIPLSPPPPVLFWTYLTRSLQFPSARDLRYTVSCTRPASLKPVKKLGGTFVLTTPGPSERGECVVQILKKSCGSRFKKKNKLLATQNNTSSYIEDLIGLTSPCLFCYHMPLSFYLNHRNCHSRNSSHSDPWWWCRDSWWPPWPNACYWVMDPLLDMGFNCNLQKGFHVVWTDPRAGSAWI